MRALFVLATLLVAAPAAQAGYMPVEAPWCTVRTGLVDVFWDCRYPTLAVCAAAVGPSRTACLKNPNWDLYRSRRR